MSNPQLDAYVKQSLAQGGKPEEIRATLTKEGWSAADVDQALPGSGMPVTMPNGAAPEMKKGHGWIILILLIVLLVGGGASAAYLVFFRTDPDAIFMKALSQAVHSHAVEYSASLNSELTTNATSTGALTVLPLLGGESGSDKPIRLLLTLDGAIDRLDPAQAKSKNSLTIASTETPGGAPIIGLEMRQSDGITYLSLTHAPANPFIDLSSFTGTWIKIDAQALSNFGSATTTLMGLAEGPDPKKVADIEVAFKELKPIYVTDTLKEEEIAGRASYHYRLGVDEEKMKAFALRIQEITGEKTVTYDDQRAKESEVTGFEVWIAKKDGVLTRLLLQAKTHTAAGASAESTSALDIVFKSFNQPLTIEVPIDAKALEDVIGQILSGGVAAPADSILPGKSDVIDLMNALSAYKKKNGQYPTLLSAAVPQVKPTIIDQNPYATYLIGVDDQQFGLEITYSDAGIKKTAIFTENSFSAVDPTATSDDHDGLSAFDEFVYGADPTKADTDGDGFNDGDEVKKGYDPNGPGKLPVAP